MIDRLWGQQVLNYLPGLPGDHIGKMGVDGGSADIRVSQKLLDDAQIHSGLKKMRSIRVALMPSNLEYFPILCMNEATILSE